MERPYVASLLKATPHTCRLPLGMPSRLRQRALDLAEGLIKTPGSSCPDGQGAEREAGYIILGALCASGLPKGQKVFLLLACCMCSELTFLRILCRPDFCLGICL